ncbi:MAG: AIR synthase family protein [Spirochaetota bacterium]
MEYLQTGKLGSSFLAELLGTIRCADEQVVVGPGIGEDAAVLDIGGRYLIVKSDPITFAHDRIGWYAVNVNANDIASMGGTPRWFLVTMLLPEGRTTTALIRDIMNDLNESCGELGVALVGGHTEVTPGLPHPILSGTMLGEVTPGGLIRAGGVRPGDLLYITRRAAIEGTSIIARERPGEVAGAFGEEFYRRCVEFLTEPGISVVADARLARESANLSGMHDPTEGGVLAGAWEMAAGSGVGLDLYPDRVPVYPETARLCAHYGLNPLGLIASGSLLLSADSGEAEKLERSFREHRGPAHLTRIGELTGSGRMYLVEGGRRREYTPTGRDEINKLL